MGQIRAWFDGDDRTVADSPAVDSTGRDPLSAPNFVAGLRPIPTEVGDPAAQPAGWTTPDIVGSSPAGDAISLRIDEVGGVVLVAFLATKCDGCDAFWQGFGGDDHPGLPPGVTSVIVTRGPDTVAPVEVGRLAADVGSPVIMTDEAWTDYRVFGYPFFVLVDSPTRTVIAETVGFGWSDLVRLVQRAVG
jgi:hypothetical protein